MGRLGGTLNRPDERSIGVADDDAVFCDEEEGEVLARSVNSHPVDPRIIGRDIPSGDGRVTRFEVLDRVFEDPSKARSKLLLALLDLEMKVVSLDGRSGKTWFVGQAFEMAT